MTTKPHLDTPRTRWTSGTAVPGDGWIYVTPGAREIFTGTALVPGWRRIASHGPDQDGDFALFGSDNASTYQFVRATDCDVRAEEPARPTVGDRVRIHAPDEKQHGKVGKIVRDDGSALPYFVHFLGRDGAEWFHPHQVSLVSDGDTFPGEADTTTAPVSVSHTTTVTLAAPATADQISRALALVPLGWLTTLHTYADRIEIIGMHEEPRG